MSVCTAQDDTCVFCDSTRARVASEHRSDVVRTVHDRYLLTGMWLTEHESDPVITGRRNDVFQFLKRGRYSNWGLSVSSPLWNHYPQICCLRSLLVIFVQEKCHPKMAITSLPSCDFSFFIVLRVGGVMAQEETTVANYRPTNCVVRRQRKRKMPRLCFSTSFPLQEIIMHAFSVLPAQPSQTSKPHTQGGKRSSDLTSSP